MLYFLGTFGSSAGTGLFGQQAQTAGTTSLFGAKTTGAGLFGTSTPSAFSNSASTGLFGSKPVSTHCVLSQIATVYASTHASLPSQQQ